MGIESELWFQEAANRDHRARQFLEREAKREHQPEPAAATASASPEPDQFWSYVRAKIEAEVDREVDSRWAARIATVNEACNAAGHRELAGALILEVARGLPLDKLEARLRELAAPVSSASTPTGELSNHPAINGTVWKFPDSRPLLAGLGFEPSRPNCRR